MCFQRFSHVQKDRKQADKQKTDGSKQTVGQINSQKRQLEVQTGARGETKNEVIAWTAQTWCQTVNIKQPNNWIQIDELKSEAELNIDWRFTAYLGENNVGQASATVKLAAAFVIYCGWTFYRGPSRTTVMKLAAWRREKQDLKVGNAFCAASDSGFI